MQGKANPAEVNKILKAKLELKYNKFYIGLSKNGLPRNFIIIRPKKNFIRFEPRLKSATETTEFLENAGLNVMDYDSRNSRYRIRLNLGDIDKQREIITQVIKEAFEEIGNE